MADDQPVDFTDPCSLISFVHQRQQVENLLNWLRGSQTVCTDTNCFDDINGFPGSEHGSPLAANSDQNDSILEDSPLALVLCFVFGLMALYAMTLNAGRRNNEETALPAKSGRFNGRRNNDDDDRGPDMHGNNDGDDSRPVL